MRDATPKGRVRVGSVRDRGVQGNLVRFFWAKWGKGVLSEPKLGNTPRNDGSGILFRYPSVY